MKLRLTRRGRYALYALAALYAVFAFTVTFLWDVPR